MSLDLHRTDLVVTVSTTLMVGHTPHKVSPTDPSGRGLHLVGVDDRAHGVRPPADSGKQVWARLPVPDSCTEWVTCEL